MKKMKCENCGGTLEVDETKEFAKCNYCGGKYKLNEDINVHIKLDDDAKKVLNPTEEKPKALASVIIVMAIFIIGVIACTMIASSGFLTGNSSSYNDNKEYNEAKEKINKENFNGQFSIYKGTQHIMFVKNLLEEVIESNQTSGRIIEVSYNETTTSNKEEIKNIKESLDKTFYEIEYDYDSNGFINKMTLK